MFHAILLPLDGSQLAEASLPHAAALAETFDAPLHLLRVIPVRRRPGSAPLDIIDRRLGQAEAGAYLNALASDLRDRGLTVETNVVEGNPADRIVEAVRSGRIGLVVLTTHGSGGGSEFPVSGTAHKVVCRAGVSVCLVPTSEGAHCAPTMPGGYRRILAGVDGSPRGDWALQPAAAIARRTGAELVLAHVVAIPETVADPAMPEIRAAADRLVRLNRMSIERRLSRARARLQGPDLPVRLRIEVGAPAAETLADIADAEQADLVVLTAHGSIGRRHPYGAVTQQLLIDAQRPVLVVQDMPFRANQPRPARPGRRETLLNHQ